MADILIVEDDFLFRQGLENVLSQFGHRTDVAESAAEALQKATARAFDLLLCDVRISGEADGVEALARVRKIRPDVRCIVMTGFSDVNAPVRAAGLQADDYLLKPFKMQALLNSIRVVLEFEPAQPTFLTRIGEATGRAAQKALRWFHDSDLQLLDEQREKALRQFFVLVRSRRITVQEAFAFFSAWEQLELTYLKGDRWGQLLMEYRRWANSMLDMTVPDAHSETISAQAFQRLYGRIQTGLLDVSHLLRSIGLLHRPETRKQNLENFCAFNWLWAEFGDQGDPFLGITVSGYQLTRPLTGGDSGARMYEAHAEFLPDSGDRVLCLPDSAESSECMQRELAAGRARLLTTLQGHHFLLYPSYAMSLKSRLPREGMTPGEAWKLLRPVFLQVQAYHQKGEVSGSFSLRDIDWPPDQDCTLTHFTPNAYREAHQALQRGGCLNLDLSAAPEVVAQADPTPLSDQAVLGRLLFEVIYGGRYPNPSLRIHIRLLGQTASNQAFAPYVERLGAFRQVFYRMAHSLPEQRFADLGEAIRAADGALQAGHA